MLGGGWSRPGLLSSTRATVSISGIPTKGRESTTWKRIGLRDDYHKESYVRPQFGLTILNIDSSSHGCVEGDTFDSTAAARVSCAGALRVMLQDLAGNLMIWRKIRSTQRKPWLVLRPEVNCSCTSSLVAARAFHTTMSFVPHVRMAMNLQRSDAICVCFHKLTLLTIMPRLYIWTITQ